MDHIKDLHARPTENETWPEPQVGGSSEATETSLSLPDLPLPVVEPTKVPTSVPVPTNEVPVPVPESHGCASSSRVIAPPSTLSATRPSQKQYLHRTHQKPDGTTTVFGTTIVICEGGV